MTQQEDKVSVCLRVLSETQTDIQRTISELEHNKVKFKIQVERKELDLKRREEIHAQRVKNDREALAQERLEFEETKGVGEYVANGGKTHIVTLDVGGDKFSTDIRTLHCQRDSIFPRLVENFDGRRSSTYVFVDRDSKHFRFILNYMRQGEEVFRCTALRGKDHLDLEEMICEARYYRLTRLVKLLERHKIRLVHRNATTFKDLLNERYFRAPNPLLSSAYETTQQLIFKRANMKGIVFENVHFKHSVSFEGSILSEAKFKKCHFDAIMDFTDAEISDVLFEHCMNATPDRFVMDGMLAEKFKVTFSPPVQLKNYSMSYRAQ
jgi:hypothetical protein